MIVNKRVRSLLRGGLSGNQDGMEEAEGPTTSPPRVRVVFQGVLVRLDLREVDW